MRSNTITGGSATMPQRTRKRYQVHATAYARTPPAAVWALLSDVTTWSTWAGFDEADYERLGAPEPHGVGAVRRFRAGRLSSREEVVGYHPGRSLTYTYDGSLPLDDYRAVVTLSRQRGGTWISWHAEFSPAWPLTGPLLRAMLTKVVAKIAGRLAAAAESEQRHEPADA